MGKRSESNARKESFLRKVLELKGQLFGAFSPTVTKDTKRQAWTELRDYAVAIGLITADKDFTYVRDATWPNMRNRTVARKLEEHRRKYERKRAEKDMKEKLERARRAREEHAKAAAAAAAASAGSGGPDEGGAPGMGDFYKFLNDPEILAAFQDPEVAAAFQDISTNPANIIKYQNNPKIAAIITKLATKFGGGSGLGGLGGGFPGFPGAFPGNFSSGESPRAPSDDVGLD